MRKNLFGNFVKTTVIIVTFFLTVLCVFPTNVDKVLAEDTNQNIYAESFDISSYQGDRAPKTIATGYEDWLFAGWYMDKSCTNMITTKPVSGKAWAKFVPADVLSVKTQVSASTTAQTSENPDAVSSIRVVSTVDTLNYSKVGFVIEIGKSKYTYETTTVYSRIKAQDVNLKYEYIPSQFNAMSQYFITATITDIPTAAFGVGIRVTPYWLTMDGTMVYGVGRYARVEDGYRNIVNVPVRLCSDKAVSAGMLWIDHNEDIFTYMGYDSGVLFGEMAVKEAVADGNKVIRTIGNSTTITDAKGDVTADGMYVNLRFQIKDFPSLEEGVYLFSISEETFCNSQETFVDLNVSDASYNFVKPNVE